MKQHIEDLIQYGLDNGVIEGRDIHYVRNQLYYLLDIVQDDDYPLSKRIQFPSDALEPLLDELVQKEMIENDQASRDFMDTKIMNVFTKLPSDLEKQFNFYYNQRPDRGTNFLYRYAINTNYIRMNRIIKNKSFKTPSAYGDLQITINLSKPEKDPKHIIKASTETSTSYPQCLLCIENEGFSGDLKRDARDQHRLLEVYLKNGQYFFQYSPYIYYNEHAIVISEEHTPMKINQKTFENILELCDIFQGYFFGSNADLPIVGGSILSHDHYQGGKHAFPIEFAKTIASWNKDDITYDILKWPLSTLRLTSLDKEKLVKKAMYILDTWKLYQNKSLMIFAKTKQTPHQTITPIARKKDGLYQLDLILRNNYTNEDYPLGYFHPHQDKWHIKKENIGLIEAMGLAILPARLDTELVEVKDYLCHQKPLSEHAVKHQVWADEIKSKYTITDDSVDQIIQKEIGSVFEKVLEDSGVFKQDETGIKAFMTFVEGIIS